MPFNGSGGFTIINTFVPGTTILSSAVNQNYTDIATTGLSNCLTKDGQQVWAANQNAGGFKISNLGPGVSGTDSVQYSQIPGIAIPIGTVIDYAGSVGVAGWLACFGQAVSRTTYSALFNVIGSVYGSGDGSTTFNVPDFRGRVAACNDSLGGTAANRIGTVVTDSGTIVGATNGSAGGSSTHIQVTAEMPVTTPAGSITIGGSQDLGTIVKETSGAVVSSGANFGAADIVVSGSNFTGTFSGTPFGSGNAMAWLQPTMIVWKLIFANA